MKYDARYTNDIVVEVSEVENAIKHLDTVAPRYDANSDITQSVVDPDFLPPGENAK